MKSAHLAAVVLSYVVLCVVLVAVLVAVLAATFDPAILSVSIPIANWKRIGSKGTV